MKNRLAISTLMCPGWSLATLVRECVEHGIAGIDFRGLGETLDHSLLPAFTSDAALTAALLRDHGLSVPCMCSSVVLMQPEERQWKDSIDEYLRYLQMADRFGSDFVRIFPGRTPAKMHRGDAVTLARRHARQLMKLAVDHQVKPILETHDDWSASGHLVELLADCAATNFPVIWDVRHTWAAGDSPPACIETLGERLAHVHVKDVTINDGAEQPVLLGEGVVNVADALKALASAGYDGWICCETEKRWWPITAPEPDASVRQFAEFVRTI